MITRRAFITTATIGLFGLALRGTGLAYGMKTYFTWAQLKYPGSWNPNPNGPLRLLETLRRRTSVEPAPAVLPADIDSPEIFDNPFLYISGRAFFPRFSNEQENRLRRYIESGGYVLLDDASGIEDSDFFQGADALISRIFPGKKLEPLPADHTVFQSFYLLRGEPAGRKLVKPFLYGMDMENLTPVILCPNDLGGAWDGDATGYTHQCVPGGERQREMSFRMGVNLVLYALTGDYKKDQVHIPFILKRRSAR